MHHPAALKKIIDEDILLFKEGLNDDSTGQAHVLLNNRYSFRGKEVMKYEEGLYLKVCYANPPLLSTISSFTFLSSSSNLHCRYVDQSYSNMSYIQNMFFHNCRPSLEKCSRVYWVFWTLKENFIQFPKNYFWKRCNSLSSFTAKGKTLM